MNQNIWLLISILFLFIAITSSFFAGAYSNISYINNVHLNNETIIISITAKQQLDNIYVPMPKNEIPVCLAGEITENNIRIDNVLKADIILSNSTYAEYIRCTNYIGTYKVIGTLHNHPNKSCRLSTTDIETYTSNKYDGQEIVGLYCGDYVFFILSEMKYEVEKW